MSVSAIRQIDEDVEQTLKNYDWTLPHSRGHLSATIRNLESTGVTPDGESALVHSPVGLLQILHTEDAFRRRGLGIIVMKALSRKSRKVAELGLVPRAECTTTPQDKSSSRLDYYDQY